MPKRTVTTNPPATIPPRLKEALGEVGALIDFASTLSTRVPLGDKEAAFIDCLDKRWSAVERAMKGRR